VRLVLLLIFVLCLGATAARAEDHMPEAHGRNARQPVDTSVWPWSAIGRVNRRDGYCTGTLIARDRVLTAAHCLWDEKADKWLEPYKLIFYAGYRKRKYIAKSRAKSYILGNGKPPDPVLRPSLSDWAVLTLSSPIGDKAGFIRTAPLTAKDWELYRAEKGEIQLSGYIAGCGHRAAYLHGGGGRLRCADPVAARQAVRHHRDPRGTADH